MPTTAGDSERSAEGAAAGCTSGESPPREAPARCCRSRFRCRPEPRVRRWGAFSGVLAGGYPGQRVATSLNSPGHRGKLRFDLDPPAGRLGSTMSDAETAVGARPLKAFCQLVLPWVVPSGSTRRATDISRLSPLASVITASTLPFVMRCALLAWGITASIDLAATPVVSTGATAARVVLGSWRHTGR